MGAELPRDAPELEPEDAFPPEDEPPRGAPLLYEPPPDGAADGGGPLGAGGGGGAEFIIPALGAGSARPVCIGWFDDVAGWPLASMISGPLPAATLCPRITIWPRVLRSDDASGANER